MRERLAGRSFSANDLRYSLLLIGLGIVAYLVSARLPFGSAERMGPGFLPRILAVGLVGMGVVNLVRAFLSPPDMTEPWPIRPMLWVTGSIALFAFAVEDLGIVVTVATAVLLAAKGDRNGRPAQVLFLAAGTAALCALVFVRLLGISIPLWPML